MALGKSGGGGGGDDNKKQSLIDIEADACNNHNNGTRRRCCSRAWLGGTSTVHEVLMGNKLCVLFPMVPLAILSAHFQFGNAWVFSISFLGLAPLAERLGFLTEQLAYYTGDTVGGLLNATCGNATEMIIAILALHRGKMDVVKSSLLGSVLSNLLLVLGSSLFCGGLRNMNVPQIFDRSAPSINICILVLATACMMLPKAVQEQYTGDGTDGDRIVNLSRGIAFLMLLAYGGYLEQQLRESRKHVAVGGAAAAAAAAAAQQQSTDSHEQQQQQEEEEEEEEEVPCMGATSAAVWLCAVTAVIAVLSHLVVETVEDVARVWNVNTAFLSAIVLPVVGNAAEHAGAVLFAARNKLDLALAVALGSATQVAAFVLPVTVLVGWLLGRNMDLLMRTPETVALVSAVALTAFSLQDGCSNYVRGLLLLLLYLLVALSFLFLKPLLDTPSSPPPPPLHHPRL